MATPRTTPRKAVQPDLNPELAKLTQALELLIAELSDLKRKQAEDAKRLDRLWIKVM
jgi:hypothetical protein